MASVRIRGRIVLNAGPTAGGPAGGEVAEDLLFRWRCALAAGTPTIDAAGARAAVARTADLDRVAVNQLARDARLSSGRGTGNGGAGGGRPALHQVPPLFEITVGVPAYRSAAETRLPRVLALPFERQRPSWQFPDAERPSPGHAEGVRARLAPNRPYGFAHA